MSTGSEKTLLKDSALRELASSSPLYLRIQGNCMHPLLKDNDVVHISSRRFYWPGDILVYRNQNDQLCVHRLLGYYPRHNHITYLTKADAAHHPDSPIKRSNIIGKVHVNSSHNLSSVTLPQRLHAFGYFLCFAAKHLVRNRITHGFW